MATKVLLKIQQQFFDIWELRSIEKTERYGEESEELEYGIILNKTSIGTNYTQIEFYFENEEARDKELSRIEEQLETYEGIIILK